jgi:PAS domain S-box-containing protein
MTAAPGAPRGWRTWANAYGVALLATGLGALVRMAVQPYLGFTLQFITFFPAVVVTAWTVGFGPAVLATALSALYAGVFLFPPLGGTWLSGVADQLGVGLFVLTGLGIGALGESRLRTVARLRFLADIKLVPGHDVRQTVRSLAESLVPGMGDLCVIDSVGADGRLEVVEVRARAAEDAEAELARRTSAVSPTHISQVERLAPEVAASRRGLLVRKLDPAVVAGHTADASEGGASAQRAPRSLMLVPLLAGERVIGTLALAHTRHTYTRADFALFEEVGRRAASVLDRAEAHERATRSLALLQRLNALSVRLAMAETADQVFDDVLVPELVSAAGATAGNVVLPIEGGARFESRKTVGFVTDEQHPFARFALAAARPGEPEWLPVHDAWVTGAPVVLASRREWEARYQRAPSMLGPAGDGTWAMLPLKGRRGTVGVLALAFPEPGGVPQDVQAYLEAATEQCALTLERIRLADERRVVEERLSAVLAQMPAGLVIREAPTGRLLLRNARAVEILGYPTVPEDEREAIAQYGFRRPDGSPYPESEIPLSRALYRGETTLGEDLHFTTAAGDERRIRVFAAPIRDAAGAVVAGVASVLDVTAEHAAREALAESERRYRTLAEVSPGLVWAASADGKATYVNPGWERYTGATLEELRTKGWEHWHHPDDLPRLRAEWAAAVAAGGTIEVEYRYRRHDGAYRWFVGRTVPVLDEQGRPRGWMGTSIDVHDSRMKEEQLRQAQRLDAVGRLAGGMAHEANNQMAVVLGFTRFVSRGENLTPAQRNDLGEVERAAARVASLTQQLLAFSRQQLLAPELVDLGAEVRSATAVLSRLIGPEVVVEVHTPPAGPWIRADRTQLAQIVINCALNARDAMPGGGSLTVSVTTAMPPGPGRLRTALPAAAELAFLAIADTGEGIPPDALRRVFDPFFTTKGVGRGSGLGLSVVEGIVAQSGGDIWVETALGAGTTFRFGFPLAGAPGAEPAVPVPAEPKPGSGRILVVDDEPSVRSMLSRTLEQAGYGVMLSANGREALEALASEDGIALVIADLSMPAMDGRALARQIGQRWPALPVLIVSGHLLDGRHGQLPAGQRHWLQKPFDPEALVAKVAAMLAEAGSPGRE